MNTPFPRPSRPASPRSTLALAALAALGALAAPAARATDLTLVDDKLTGATTTYQWIPLGGACLTAGTSTVISTSSTVPACKGLSYYTGKGSTLVGGTVSGTFPDADGSGALRLTNGDTTTGSNGDNQAGAVVSNFTFPSNKGLAISFNTFIYGGDNLNNTGADGVSFFLSDGSKDPTVGGLGGSLGYSCSNVNPQYDGVMGGYIGVGIDEFGNFNNAGDNTNTGAAFTPKAITVRGAGSTNWAWLNANYPSYYPSSLDADHRAQAVHETCKAGKVMNWSGQTVGAYQNGWQTSIVLPNYPVLKTSTLPNSVSLANQQATASPTRGAAVPISYKLRLTQDGLLDFSYSISGGSYQPVISALDISESNGTMPANFRFGFSSGTGSGSNVHEITCFKAAPTDQSESSAGSNVQESQRVVTGSQAYLAYFHSNNWWGQLSAYSLTNNSGVLSVSSTANWDANCGLTGSSGASCPSSASALGPSSRNLLTWSGSAGIALTWSALQTASMDTYLGSQDRLNYLRGERGKEVANSGALRTRTGVLGDIIDASPVWVGPPNYAYTGSFTDQLYSSTTPIETAGAYATFQTTYKTRQNLVYVGANDGYLHAFKAGGYDATGTWDSTKANDGAEAFAYMPKAVVKTIYSTDPVNVDYTSPQYAHNFYVDATPGVGDLYYNSNWHTWLAGGLGPGAQADGAINDNTTAASGSLYLLDITNPTNLTQANASTVVLSEIDGSSLSCASDGGGVNCKDYFGQIYGTPLIRRLHNNKWAVMFGNGRNSSAGKAGLFIIIVDPTNGSRTVRFISTGTGSTTNRNGLVQITAADLDGDHITDYVYGGDLYGNVWRFDLTSSTASSWSVSSSAIFSTPNSQPISTSMVVGSVPGTGTSALPRVIVAFGTGSKQPQTTTSAEVYASGTQTLYGVWDWNLTGWNAKNPSATYAAVTAGTTGLPTSSVSNFQQQTVTSTQAGDTASVSGYRTVSTTTVCWYGSGTCSGTNNKMGWYLDLPTTNEQVVYNPVLTYNNFIVNTTVPPTSSLTTCATTPQLGYTMALQLESGGAGSASFFANASGDFASYDGKNVAGIGLNATGTPSVVLAGSNPYLITQTTSNVLQTPKINPTGGVGARMTWTKVR